MSTKSLVPKVRTLRARWQADAALQQAINASLDRVGFSESYISELAQKTLGHRKAIKDSVWGMLEFSREEMAIIDSPLLQRLRRIKQLGFTYLTYHTAEHSRFVHSLGMASIVSRFVASINRDHRDDNTTFSDRVRGYRDFSALHPLQPRELVYAGLLHDIGHMPFSHASETAVNDRQKVFTCGDMSVQDLMTVANLFLEKADSISEILSLLIVLSVRFAAFYAAVDPDLARDDNSILRIACLIAGKQTVDDCPNIQHIISATALDADKIDYISRDSRACGISVGVDVSRIFLGGGLVEAQAKTLDPESEADVWQTLFVVNASGADTLDEIIQARSALFQRVYLHPVTRTAEALLTKGLHLNAIAPEAVLNRQLRDILSLWALDDHELVSLMAASSDPAVSTLGARLRLRDLPKKACAIAAKLTQAQVPLDHLFSGIDASQASKLQKDVGNTLLERLTREQAKTLDVLALEQKIADEAIGLRDALRAGDHAELVPKNDLKLVVFTPIAPMDVVKTDPIVFQGGELLRMPLVTNVTGQQDALHIFKAVGYVMCDPDWRAIVLHASRRVIYDLSRASKPEPVDRVIDPGRPKFKLRFQLQTLLEFEGTARRANISADHADEIGMAAAEVGYFDDAPLLAKRQDKHDPTVRAIARNLQVFDGDWGWRVTKETIAAFVDQFPPRLRNDALAMLGSFRQLDQLVTGDHVTEAVNSAHATFGGDFVMAPLSPSSGGGVQASVKDRLPEFVRQTGSVEAALGTEPDAIMLLVDDNAASGIQSAAQLYEFADISDERRPRELAAEPKFVRPLSASLLGKLRKRRFALCVAVGSAVAEARLQSACANLGLNGFLGVFRGADIEANFNWPPALRLFLEEVGRDLIAQHEFGMAYADLPNEDDKRYCREHCFGYGNFGGLLATQVNVPASTVTALWQPGTYQGRPWIPLLLRRGRLHELILA